MKWMSDSCFDKFKPSVLQRTGFNFDASVWELFLPLFVAGKIVTATNTKLKNPKELKKIVEIYLIDTVQLVPALIDLLDQEYFFNNVRLKNIFVGGEPLTSKHVNMIRRGNKKCLVYNLYGPTEATIDASSHQVLEFFKEVPIGRPISNTQIHILDMNLNRVPIGSIGELHIGGVGLARGYLNKPGLTSEKFIANPFGDAGTRLYKTGDLARYLPDGNIEFMGRVDHQVKMRGFRIELGEIESAIALVSGVKQVIVLAREDEPNQKRLVAYIILDGKKEEAACIENIRRVCAEQLPDYMQPSQIVVLAEMPLTLNGKIDRKALPKPEGREGLEAYQEPQGFIEKELSIILEELLNISRVGRNDNFFSLGGDSIVSIQLVSRARKLGINFEVKQIFETPTIAGIAANSTSQEEERILQEWMTGSVALLPIQEYFFEQKLVKENHYNQSMWFMPKNKLNKADKERLKSGLKSIYDHHDTLRLRYNLESIQNNNEDNINVYNRVITQYYHEDNPFIWEELTIDTWDNGILFQEGTKIQASLDIVHGPTSRVVWFESKDGNQGILWVIHHLLIDGVSWRILLDDLNTVFENKPLPDKSYSYQAFSDYLRQRDDLAEVMSYYQGIEGQYIALTTDNKIKESEEVKTNNLSISFTQEETLNFIQKTHHSYNTQANDLLLTALLLAIGNHKGSYDLWLDLEGHGREGKLNLSRSLGWFTNMYPVYIKLSNPRNLSGCIKEVKERLRQIPEKGIGYGICASQGKISPIKGDLIFNYLGQWDAGRESYKYFNFGYSPKGYEVDASNKPSHALIFDGGIQDGALSFTLSYSNEYNKETIVKIANSFKTNFQNLINHCTNPCNYGYTPSDFELITINQERIDDLFNQRDIQDVYPLTPIQSGLIFQHLYKLDSDAYFIQSVFETNGELNVKYLKAAWQVLLERHEGLRASFIYQGLDNPIQVIHKYVNLPWREEDISNISQAEQTQKLEYIIQEERKKGFNIQMAPLMRFNLLKRNKDSYYLICNQHHLITDGWSMPILLSEVTKIYASLINNIPLDLKIRRPYKDYITWLSKQDQGKAIQYWHKELQNIVPTKIGSEIVGESNDKEEIIILSEVQTRKLTQFAMYNGVTLNTLLQAIWSLILSQQTRQREVVFGVTVSGRNIPLSGIEDMVGIFINTLPLKVEIYPNEDIKTFLQKIQRSMSLNQDNLYIPLSTIQATQKERELFDSIFVFANYPLEELHKISEDKNTTRLNLNPIKLVEKTEYPISVMVCPGKQTYIHINYQYNYFTNEKISNIKHGIINFCENIQQNNIAVGNIISVAHDDSIKLTQWNNTNNKYPKGKTVHELFEESVQKFPDRIAVIYEDKQINYRQLNEKANQLARYLVNKGVSLETPVAISTPRGIDLIIGLLAIFKTGGVYVPLDSEYPRARLSHMLDDSKAKILLTISDFKDQFDGGNYLEHIIYLDAEETQRNVGLERKDNLYTRVLPDSLCYIIYTSGSTGTPKGVAIAHEGLSHIIWDLETENPDATKRGLIPNVSMSFDPSLWLFMWPLSYGGNLILCDKSLDNKLDEVGRLVYKNRTSVFQAGPAMLNMMLNVSNVQDFRTLGSIIGGGEVWSVEGLRNLANNLPNVKIKNGYGPTETSIYVSLWRQSQDLPSVVPIGRPISNTQIHILDMNLNRVPIGSIGELHIGGVGLARGYLNKPGLTSEKFIANPFGDAGTRLYKTGDLARYLPDGNIEFMGRVDHQVKMRGFRIELGEIESAIALVSGVKQVIVLAREDEPNQKRLVAYIILDGKKEEAACIENIRRVCAEQLPDYMQPSQIVVLAEMPLTLNGKIDRKALPKPEGREGLEAYQEPQGLLENRLASIWMELLQVDRVGRRDNFFHLGGHSLIATRLISKIRKSEKVEVPLRAVFEHPVLSDLAHIIEQKYQSTGLLPPITTVPRVGPLPLSFAQQRLWFIEQLLSESSGLYHIPITLRIKGDLNEQALKHALDYLVSRHEILRTKLITVDGVGYQEILDKTIGFNLILEDLTEATSGNLGQIISDEIHKPFANNGVLCRGLCIKLSAKERILVLTFHHIISDGWSTGIFNKELSVAYESYTHGKAPSLPDLTVQYVDYSVWQRGWLSGEILKGQLSYWQGQLLDAASLEISTDRSRPSIQSYKGGYYGHHVSQDVLNVLNKLSKEEGVTLFMTLLSIFSEVLTRISNQYDIVIGTPIANRNSSEVEGLIGFFVNTLAIRIDTSKNPTFKELLKRVEKVTLGAYEHQDVPFEQLVEYLNIPRDLSRHPLFQVMFVLQNMEMTNISLGDLELQYEDSDQLRRAKFDLTLNAIESPEGLYLGFEYAQDLFDEQSIIKLAKYYESFLKEVASNAEIRLSNIEILDKEELSTLTNWNKTEEQYPKDKCIHELFEEVSETSQDRIALVYEGKQLSYGELNNHSNQLSHLLHRAGVDVDVLVGISAPRGLEFVVGMLGILKSGGAYVPLDPEYPEERLSYMIEDSKIEILLTVRELSDLYKNYTGKIIYLDDYDYSSEPKTNLNLTVPSDSIAYVIYTSGSTGRPKGVLTSHYNVKRLFDTTDKYYKFAKTDVWLLFHSCAFDFAVWEQWGALIYGGKLITINKLCARTPEKLFQKLLFEKVTVLNQTPSAFESITREMQSSGNRINSLAIQTVIFGGEYLDYKILQPWEKNLKTNNISLVNMYGITETTVHVTYNPIATLNEPVNLGKQLKDLSLYILDMNLNRVPIGSIGELHIGGVGLARGYLNKPGLTSEKFIANPFGDAGTRLYKTGDLARYLPDGNIEFMGRVDHQVKMRGFRIELGEIESAIALVSGVKQVIVLAREDEPNQKRLVAYIILDGKKEEAACIENIRRVCAEQLPDYMQPSQIVVLAEMPLTLNGKIDRKALPKPEGREGLEAYQEPQGLLENRLASIWMELLQVDRVGRRDNFFHLGGHSLIATRLISKIRKSEKVEVPLRAVFEHPVLSDLAHIIEQKYQSTGLLPPITTVPRVGPLPLSFAQQRLWFIEQLLGLTVVVCII
jgi:amino acid adenylation domain-containing protein/non-ribosomal peptide synthase protein (TIGR01720 family)